MTTGTILRDSRYSITTDCGTGLAGNYFSKSWSGGDDPLKKAINNYSCNIVSSFNPEIVWGFTNNPGRTYTGTYASCFGGIVAETVAFGDNDQLNLVNRLGDQIRQHDFDAANSIGAEGKDALKQIAGTAGNLYRAGKALKRGDVPTAAAELGIPNPLKRGRRESRRQQENNKLGKNLSNSVLAVQLGALPLMSDIASAADALITMLNRDMRKTYVSKSVAKGYVRPATALPGTNVCGTIRNSKKLTWTITAQPTGFEQLSMANPWDLADLLWNFTALSFVADWALPLGKFLSARSVAYDITGSGFENHKIVVEGRTSFAPPGHFVSKGEYRYRSVSFKRTFVGSLQVPLPSFNPVEKIPSWTRALTAVSLLGQLALK